MITNKVIQKIKYTIGIDKPILYTSLGKVIQSLGGIISLLLIATYLTGVEQGFYFTFASLLSIQIFFELGLNNIITQYVAHEVAHLTQNGNQYEGSDKCLSRMASLLHFLIKWYTRMALSLFIVLVTVGFVFFSKYYHSNITVVWKYPWILLCISTTLYFLISPFIAFIEGLGKVKEVAKFRFVQQIVLTLITWCAFYVELKLYVGGIAQLISIFILAILIIKKFLPLLRFIKQINITEKISYRNEIFPFQWKIALSWISGYFTIQLFNPILFATEGAVVAGKMGMTLTALNALIALSFSWIATKIPTYSSLIAKKNYASLDILFNRTLWQSASITLLGLITMFVIIFFIQHYNITFNGKNLGNRFLPYIPMILMMLTTFLNHFIASWAIYLRSHKKEPMMVLSITIGIVCTFSTIFLGKFYGVIGMTIGYALLCIINFIGTFFIFKKYKNLWHYK
ncbi:MAG: hypothetical protein ACRC0A_00110 [Chitinophagaceae bacterium]